MLAFRLSLFSYYKHFNCFSSFFFFFTQCIKSLDQDQYWTGNDMTLVNRIAKCHLAKELAKISH